MAPAICSASQLSPASSAACFHHATSFTDNTLHIPNFLLPPPPCTLRHNHYHLPLPPLPLPLPTTHQVVDVRDVPGCGGCAVLLKQAHQVAKLAVQVAKDLHRRCAQQGEPAGEGTPGQALALAQHGWQGVLKRPVSSWSSAATGMYVLSAVLSWSCQKSRSTKFTQLSSPLLCATASSLPTPPYCNPSRAWAPMAPKKTAPSPQASLPFLPLSLSLPQHVDKPSQLLVLKHTHPAA